MRWLGRHNGEGGRSGKFPARHIGIVIPEIAARVNPEAPYDDAGSLIPNFSIR